MKPIVILLLIFITPSCATYSVYSAKTTNEYCRKLHCPNAPENAECANYACMQRYCPEVENPRDCEHIDDLVVICNEDMAVVLRDCHEREIERKGEVSEKTGGFFTDLLKLAIYIFGG